MPAKMFQGGCDAVLLCSADPRRFDVQGLARDLTDGHPGLGLQVLGDVFLPDIGLIAGCLFGRDVPALEILVRPPLFTTIITVHGLGEELVAIAGDGIHVDVAGLDWPEAAAAGFVAEIGVAVGRADEDALSGVDLQVKRVLQASPVVVNA